LSAFLPFTAKNASAESLTFAFANGTSKKRLITFKTIG